MSDQPSVPTRREHWFRHVKHWQSSGLTQAAWCRQHKLKPASFYQWKAKYLHEQNHNNLSIVPASTQPHFIPVNLQTPPGELTLSCGDVRLHFSGLPTPEAMIPWIKALRAGAC